MAQQASTSSGTTRSPAPAPGEAWAAGGTMFAGVLLLVDGILGILNGIAGIAADDVYTRIGSYVFEWDLTAWGWIHLIIGVIAAVTGAGILRNAGWARAVGVALAGLIVIINFIWLPYLPLWGLIGIAIGVFVIWALCADWSASSSRVE
ncbi:hypothetical protein [Streptomyces sp. V1I1]|uniref:DUF7144 family membrane protein n=1 Tax=Streptomyces sp. V1I1 TaxID=3042272 RepID=UPI00278264D1|nr:hypothetical protein [Streptomyces sp. V1I1]MDQ0942314.1 hypothetical protein [Streptomyces sp. V1I1]